MPQIMTQGWVSQRDLTNQCDTCHWVLRQHKLGCCEFDRPEFPRAVHCPKFQDDKEGDE